MRDVTFIDGGLVPGKHYAEVRPDLGDLTDVVRYYSNHLDEAQRIANAGHDHFARYLATRGRLISSYVFDTMVASWGDLYRPATHKGAFAAARSVAARLFPRRF
jgi:hypothetical protein